MNQSTLAVEVCLHILQNLGQAVFEVVGVGVHAIAGQVAA